MTKRSEVKQALSHENYPEIRASAKQVHVFRTLVASFLFLLLLSGIYLTVYYLNQRHGRDISIDKTGAVNFTDTNFESTRMNFLENGWQFYPEQLLVPGDFDDSSNYLSGDLPKYDCSDLPHYSNVSISINGWTDMGDAVTANDDSLSKMKNYGYGTYRIVMKLSDYEDMVALDFPEINQAAKIWVNGRLEKEIGSVSDSKEGYVYEEASTNIKTLPDTDGTIEIVIQVSNYSSAYGGITFSPGIGSPTQIDNLNVVSKMWITSMFTLIIMIVLTGFYISFTFQSRLKYYYFILIITMSLAYEYCDKVFNPLPGDWNRLLQLSIALCMTLAATLYFSSLFTPENEDENPFKHWDVHVIFSLTLIFLITIWAKPTLLHCVGISWAYTIFACLINGYNMIRVFYYTLRDPEVNYFHAISAVAATFIFATIQIRSPQIYIIPLHSIGTVIVIIFVSIVFTTRYVCTYNKVARFTVELEHAVKEKTRNLAKVNAELLTANQTLINNEDARKKMMSNVSHDLRTPIAAIRGYIELMLNENAKLSPDAVEGYLKNMHTRSLQMEQLISDLMQLTRLESDNAAMKVQPLSMKMMIENLFDLYLMECEGTGKKLTLDVPDHDSLMIVGDPNHLMRVFENLIVNAIRYTEENGEVKIVALREAAASGEERIHIIVKDNGFGIPANEITYIFDRFYRASNAAGRKNGSGLGLSIVKSIIDKHNGTIWVESWEKKGSNFHVLLHALPLQGDNDLSEDEASLKMFEAGIPNEIPPLPVSSE